MYATVSDLLKDLFGFYIPLPIQTFGFFMAISFAFAYITTSSELKRKEKNGLLHSFTKKITVNKKITGTDYAVSIFIGALLGFKVVEMFLDYSSLIQNPQEFILSSKGSLFGLIAGAAVAFYLKKKESDSLKEKEEKETVITVHPYHLMGNIVAIAAIAGILGSKIFHNLENLDELARDPWGSIFSFSGLTFYGGLILAAISILYYTNKNHIPHVHMVDAAAPALMLAYGIGRIGCHLSGDGDWGINNLAPKPSLISFLPDWMWSFRYPHNVVNEGIPMVNCVGNHCKQLEFPVFPTPFYEAVTCILLFVFLWSIRKKIRIPGMLFSIYLMLNGVERFFVEKIRINTTYNLFGHHITQAEIISTLLFIAGLTGFVILQRRNKTT
ncbi:MAG: prolipoprotein diacylglyceryl transferase [Bacteroidia bacterium]